MYKTYIETKHENGIGWLFIDTPSYFFQETGFDVSCKLAICMKCQILFVGKNKKNITNLSSAELAKIVVKVKS